MKRIGFAVLLVTIQPHTALGDVPDELLSTPLAAIFGAAPAISDPQLSPDGTHIVFLQQDAAGTSVARSLNLADGSGRLLLSGTPEGYDIFACRFANADRVLCDLHGGPREQHWVAVNLDGSDLIEMPRGTGCGDLQMLRNTYRIDWLPEDSEHVLFSCYRAAARVNVYSGNQTHVWGEIAALQLYTDGYGFANMYVQRIDEIEKWLVRDARDTGWVLLQETDMLRFEDPFRPVGYGSDRDSLLHIAWNPKTETWALFSRQLGADADDRLVFAHPDVDVEFVQTLGPYERVVAAVYDDGTPRQHIIDERIEAVRNAVADALGGRQTEIVDASWDGSVYLARARANDRAGEWFVANLANATVEPIGLEYPALGDRALAPTRLVGFDAEPRRRVSGRLTLPSESSGPAPAVIIARGEALHSAVARPHYLTEFLAASGYAVLRVDTRGPGGGGWLSSRSELGWAEAADDVRAAAAFLVDRGITEQGKICVAGENYGAYTALMSTLRHPEAFACVVTIGGVIDPRRTLAAPMIRYGEQSPIGLVTRCRSPAPRSDWVERMIPCAESQDIVSPVPYTPEETSPIARADEFKAPILLFHGRRDMFVEMADHAQPFSRALDKADKVYEFVEYPFDDYSMSRAPNRTDMLVRIEAFLREKTR